MFRWLDRIPEPDTALIQEMRDRIERTEKLLDEERALVRRLIDHQTHPMHTGDASPAPAAPPIRERSVPSELLRAARKVSPTNDKTYEYNLNLIMQHEDIWDDQGQVARLAENIVRGAVVS